MLGSLVSAVISIKGSKREDLRPSSVGVMVALVITTNTGTEKLIFPLLMSL